MLGTLRALPGMLHVVKYLPARTANLNLMSRFGSAREQWLSQLKLGAV